MPELTLTIDGLGNKLVKPTDNTLHRGYMFYMRITALGVNSLIGDNIKYFGPYDLRVGCYADS